MGLPTLLPDIHNHLLRMVNSVRCHEVEYGQNGEMHINRQNEPKPRIRTNIIRAGFEQGGSGREETVQIASMEVELLVEFRAGVEANLENLENLLMSKETIVVPRREVDELHNGHETVFLRLQEGNFTHPPSRESESGTFARYLFSASPTKT